MKPERPDTPEGCSPTERGVKLAGAFGKLIALAWLTGAREQLAIVDPAWLADPRNRRDLQQRASEARTQLDAARAAFLREFCSSSAAAVVLLGAELKEVGATVVDPVAALRAAEEAIEDAEAQLSGKARRQDPVRRIAVGIAWAMRALELGEAAGQ